MESTARELCQDLGVADGGRPDVHRPILTLRRARYNGSVANVSDEGQPPERFSGSHISANGLAILGTTPVIGRNFVPDDDRRGAAAVVIIGHGMYQNRYGSNPSVIGRTIRVNDTPATVIGIMPEGFKFPFNTDLWMPLSQIPNLEQQQRNSRQLQTFGHLAPA